MELFAEAHTSRASTCTREQDQAFNTERRRAESRGQSLRIHTAGCCMYAPAALQAAADRVCSEQAVAVQALPGQSMQTQPAAARSKLVNTICRKLACNPKP